MIWFTHGLAEVMAADQVLVMCKGRVVWRGQPATLLTMAEEARAWACPSAGNTSRL